MNKTLAKGIAIVLLVLISITGLTFLWLNAGTLQYIFEKEVDYNIIDPTTGEKYTLERKYRYVLSSEIDKLIQSENPKKALFYIDSILPQYENEKNIHFQKGLSLAMIDSFKLAIKSFDKSLNLSKNSYLSAFQYKYICQVELKQYDDALKTLDKAVILNPDYKLDIAEVYELKGDYKNSIKYYKMTVDEWENSKNVGSLFSDIQELKNRIKELEVK